MQQISPKASRLWRLLIALAIGMFASSLAQAASPSAKPRANPPSGYALSVEDEVDMQNLTCDQIRIFLTKPLGASLAQAAEDILDQPVNINETSQTLFGPRLTNIILQSSGLMPPCRTIVPESNSKYRMDPTACWGPPGMVGNIANLGMSQLDEIPFHRPGELKVLGMFSTAAKLKNCRI